MYIKLKLTSDLIFNHIEAQAILPALVDSMIALAIGASILAKQLLDLQKLLVRQLSK
jgi:hypothetical protein